MHIVRISQAMRAYVDAQRAAGKHIAVVPTMGSLHDGHLSLLHAARNHADIVIMTLFVNPTQFGPQEDLSRYPRDEASDVALATTCGIDAIFAPTADAMYPPSHQTIVRVPHLAEPLCGASRPHHFDGVATVVAKLFHITQPHTAFFGEKDFQQLALIRQMVLDLSFAIDIVGMPIVREHDGLAMSSRNQYLSAQERAQARCLSRSLTVARNAFDQGERDAAVLTQLANAVLKDASLATTDYVQLLDAVRLAPINRVQQPAVLAIAVWFGATRLIDNVILRSEP